MYSLAHTIAAAALALSLTTSSVPARQDTAPATPQCSTVNVAGQPQTISGRGSGNSAPILLDGGSYQVDWKLSEPTKDYVMLKLQSIDPAAPSRTADYLVTSMPPASTSSGQSFAYSVKPGTYYLEVRAPAGWTVTLTPITP
jgi:hypothetical protein